MTGRNDNDRPRTSSRSTVDGPEQPYGRLSGAAGGRGIGGAAEPRTAPSAEVAFAKAPSVFDDVPPSTGQATEESHPRPA